MKLSGKDGHTWTYRTDTVSRATYRQVTDDVDSTLLELYSLVRNRCGMLGAAHAGRAASI